MPVERGMRIYQKSQSQKSIRMGMFPQRRLIFADAGPTSAQVREGSGLQPLHPGRARADDHVRGARGDVLCARVFYVIFVDRTRDARARTYLPLPRSCRCCPHCHDIVVSRYDNGDECQVPVAALLEIRNLGAATPFILSSDYFTPNNNGRNPTLARKIVGAAVSGIVSSSIMDVFSPVFFFLSRDPTRRVSIRSTRHTATAGDTAARSRRRNGRANSKSRRSARRTSGDREAFCKASSPSSSSPPRTPGQTRSPSSGRTAKSHGTRGTPQ